MYSCVFRNVFVAITLCAVCSAYGGTEKGKTSGAVVQGEASSKNKGDTITCSKDKRESKPSESRKALTDPVLHEPLDERGATFSTVDFSLTRSKYKKFSEELEKKRAASTSDESVDEEQLKKNVFIELFGQAAVNRAKSTVEGNNFTVIVEYEADEPLHLEIGSAELGLPPAEEDSSSSVELEVASPKVPVVNLVKVSTGTDEDSSVEENVDGSSEGSTKHAVTEEGLEGEDPVTKSDDEGSRTKPPVEEGFTTHDVASNVELQAKPDDSDTVVDVEEDVDFSGEGELITFAMTRNQFKKFMETLEQRCKENEGEVDGEQMKKDVIVQLFGDVALSKAKAVNEGKPFTLRVTSASDSALHLDISSAELNPSLQKEPLPRDTELDESVHSTTSDKDSITSEVHASSVGVEVSHTEKDELLSEDSSVGDDMEEPAKVEPTVVEYHLTRGQYASFNKKLEQRCQQETGMAIDEEQLKKQILVELIGKAAAKKAKSVIDSEDYIVSVSFETEDETLHLEISASDLQPLPSVKSKTESVGSSGTSLPSTPVPLDPTDSGVKAPLKDVPPADISHPVVEKLLLSEEQYEEFVQAFNQNLEERSEGGGLDEQAVAESIAIDLFGDAMKETLSAAVSSDSMSHARLRVEAESVPVEKFQLEIAASSLWDNLGEGDSVVDDSVVESEHQQQIPPSNDVEVEFVTPAQTMPVRNRVIANMEDVVKRREGKGYFIFKYIPGLNYGADWMLNSDPRYKTTIDFGQEKGSLDYVIYPHNKEPGVFISPFSEAVTDGFRAYNCFIIMTVTKSQNTLRKLKMVLAAVPEVAGVNPVILDTHQRLQLDIDFSGVYTGYTGKGRLAVVHLTQLDRGRFAPQGQPFTVETFLPENETLKAVIVQSIQSNTPVKVHFFVGRKGLVEGVYPIPDGEGFGALLADYMTEAAQGEQEARAYLNELVTDGGLVLPAPPQAEGSKNQQQGSEDDQSRTVMDFLVRVNNATVFYDGDGSDDHGEPVSLR